MRKYILLALCLLTIPEAFAKAGQDRGGGDLCESRIKSIAGDIREWILNRGHEALVLKDVSHSVYQTSMLKEIDRARVRCVSAGDQGHPVQISGVPKVCVWDRSWGKASITCDTAKFQALGESQQYELIHHEYAGLADLEKPNGSNSSYQISNQISGYLENQVVKKLAVKLGSRKPRDGKWKYSEGEDGIRVAQGLSDLLKAAKFSDCTVEILQYAEYEYCHKSAIAKVHYDFRLKSNPHTVARVLPTDFNCEARDGYKKSRRHLMLQEGVPGVIRQLVDQDYAMLYADGKYEDEGTMNAIYTLNEDDTQIKKIDFVFTRKDKGTLTQPITNGKDILVHSFTCNAIPK